MRGGDKLEVNILSAHVLFEGSRAFSVKTLEFRVATSMDKAVGDKIVCWPICLGRKGHQLGCCLWQQ